VSVAVEDLDRLFGAREGGGAKTALVFYSLYARLRSGEVRPILHHLHRPITAMFVQQCIEEYLEASADAGLFMLTALDEIDGWRDMDTLRHRER